MIRVLLGGVFLAGAVLLAVDYLLTSPTESPEKLARMRLYEQWINSGILS